MRTHIFLCWAYQTLSWDNTTKTYELHQWSYNADNENLLQSGAMNVFHSFSSYTFTFGLMNDSTPFSSLKLTQIRVTDGENFLGDLIKSKHLFAREHGILPIILVLLNLAASSSYDYKLLCSSRLKIYVAINVSLVILLS